LSRDEEEIEASRAPLMDHLVELRQRLIVSVIALGVGFLICFAFSGQIYLWLLRPFEMAAAMLAAEKQGAHHGPFDLLMVVMGLSQPPSGVQALRLVFTAPLEFFFTKMKLSAFGGIILAFPVVAWQLYRFVAPGLYKQEKRAFLPFLVAAPVLFVMGSALVYFIMLPFVLWFSLSQQIVAGNVSVELLPKVSDYLALVTQLMLAFGLCFQLPVVLTLAAMAGLVEASTLAKGRRYAIVAIVFVAAILTPPDPLSQMLLAVPIYLLYEVSIWCVRLMELRKKRDEKRALVPSA